MEAARERIVVETLDESVGAMKAQKKQRKEAKKKFAEQEPRRSGYSWSELSSAGRRHDR